MQAGNRCLEVATVATGLCTYSLLRKVRHEGRMVNFGLTGQQAEFWPPVVMATEYPLVLLGNHWSPLLPLSEVWVNGNFTILNCWLKLV